MHIFFSRLVAPGKMRSYFVVPLLLVLAAASLTSAEIYFKKGAPHVKLANDALLSGSLAHSRDGRPYNSFLGIPYGKVPARFEEAQPIKEPAWEGVYNAVMPGAFCIQPIAGIAEAKGFGQEDCLNLNVFVPMNNTQKAGGLPVMVWIHGGGFTIGGGFAYGPKFFMDEDVILVSFNYRLGIFGFLSTGDSVIPGNNGLKDQVLALRWVQENIGNFGGDPGKVTIFGESAGGSSVHHLLLSPTTKGLFHRALAQSATALSSWGYMNKNDTLKIANCLNCTTTGTSSLQRSEEIVACLRSYTAEELNVAQVSFRNRWPTRALPLHFGPTLESETSKNPFLTKPAFSSMKEPFSNNGVPLMIGITEDEGATSYAGYILSDNKLLEELSSNWDMLAPRTLELDKFVGSLDEQKVMAKRLRQFYFGEKMVSPETRQNLTNMYSDAFFAQPVRRAALEAAKHKENGPVYLYQYSYHGPLSAVALFGFPSAEEETKKVAHGDELLLLFDLGALSPAAADAVKPDSADEEFSREMIKLWTSFAIHGKPTHSWGTMKDEWKPISKDEAEGKRPLKWLSLNANLSFIENPIKERATFWDELYSNLLPGFSS